ncbi:tartrate dehydrogenase [Marinobacterium sediminicola]|uniref:D-malate dehydrogenase (decarboxylating) n=1 Tax=Marinobacterium sediminicola TaxID=518898 RepID=A0ABY1RYS2_9GAMM|nr:tartrate dehydrogenase [Marinobacterium sediminicola]ULG68027.1 tartrate dehydrogenase [Marinobacterium sediminicola]SMR73463.1 tartrate dehydrogenase/decarboxylase / D-malate dehydrogenase [Marinobacterium sediminicola]
MSQFNIAVIPGDGIGTEVIPEGIKALEAAAAKHGVELNFTHFDWSCETYHRTGRMMPEDGLDQLKQFDSIFLGAVGFPGVPDHISLWGLLLPIRRAFNQYVNLRPVRLFEGLQSPLANKQAGDIDFYVVRENVEGEYSNIGGIQYEGTDDEVVSQQSIFTRKGTDRILKYAFDLAQSRDKKHLSSATKSNGLFHSMPYWDSRVEAMAERYPDVKVDQFHIDIFTANLVRMPEFYDVIVGSNLFGDILSDLGPACTGTIAIAPSANINPEKEFPSMFEPVHGSAPDIAGQNIANPIGTVWAAAMMMQHLGCDDMHDTIMGAIETVIRDQLALTRDMGGNASTQELGQAIADIIRA